MFYRPFSYFFWNFEIKLLVLYCSECHFKNRLALSLPKFFLQPLLKIHFQIFMKIHHSQWFIDIGYVNLTTKNRGALGRKIKVRYLYFLYITWGRFDLRPILFRADLTCHQHIEATPNKNWYPNNPEEIKALIGIQIVRVFYNPLPKTCTGTKINCSIRSSVNYWNENYAFL
jgi:hypothetical protein